MRRRVLGGKVLAEIGVLYVYKVGDRGQHIDEAHTFFEEACARVSRFSRCEMITRAPPRHLCTAAVVLV